jgi:tryptophan synthase alpha subunit
MYGMVKNKRSDQLSTAKNATGAMRIQSISFVAPKSNPELMKTSAGSTSKLIKTVPRQGKT